MYAFISVCSNRKGKLILTFFLKFRISRCDCWVLFLVYAFTNLIICAGCDMMSIYQWSLTGENLLWSFPLINCETKFKHSSFLNRFSLIVRCIPSPRE